MKVRSTKSNGVHLPPKGVNRIEETPVVLTHHENRYEPHEITQIQYRDSDGNPRYFLSNSRGRKDYEAKEQTQHEKRGTFRDDMQCKGFPGDRIPGNDTWDTDEFQRQSKSFGGMFIDGSSVSVG